MAKPLRKHTVEERDVYMNNSARLEREALLVDQNKKQLKQEVLSLFKETKRKCTDDDNELSVISSNKRPKELKGHNKFETAKHWATPTRQRERKKPTDIYVPENNVGSPVSSMDLPLAGTRRTLVTDNYIGTRVAFKCIGGVIYGTVRHFFLNDRQAKTWECVYDNKDKEELLVVDFRKQQKLYAKERMYGPKINSNQPPIQQPQPPPLKPPSTTKKDNTKKQKSVQKQISQVTHE